MCKYLNIEVIPLCGTDLTEIFLLSESIFLMVLVKKTRSFGGLRKDRTRDRQACHSLLPAWKEARSHRGLLLFS